MKTLVVAIAVIFSFETAAAHPGHGVETGLGHFLTSPFHIVVGLGIALAVFGVWYVRRGARQRLY